MDIAALFTEFLERPIIIFLANMITDLLITNGIINVHYKDAVIQLFSNLTASALSFGFAIYTTHRVIDLIKHQKNIPNEPIKISLNNTPIAANQSMNPSSQPDPEGQSGIPISTQSL